MSNANPIPMAILAGLRGRCPNCGEGPLFSGFLRIAPKCQACGFDLTKADSGDGPAVFILLIVGAIVCFGALFTQVALNPPVWIQLVVWLPSAAMLSLLALRPFKGVMVALQFHNRASQAGSSPDQRR